MDEDNQAERKPPTGGKKRRRWRWIVAFALVALVLLFILLPGLLSTGPGRSLLVRFANARMEGSVAVKSCSLSWLSGFEFKDVQVRDETGAELVSIDVLRVSASVPQLLGSTRKLGTVEVENPRLTVDLSERGFPGPAGPAARAPAEEPERLPFDLTGTIRITGGSVSVADGDARLFTINDLGIEADIQGLSQPISYSVRGKVADGGGAFTAAGSARVAQEGRLRPEALQGDMKIGLERFELAVLEPFIQRAGPPLEISGTLDANLEAEFEGPRNFAATGKAAVNSLVLAGEPLRGDRPAVASARLSFDARSQGETIALRELKLDSPLARASMSGTLPMKMEDIESLVQLEGSLSVELPEVAAQLRNTLRLRPGLTIAQGRMLGDFSLSTGEDEAALRAGLKLAELAAEQDGRRIASGAPVEIDLSAGLDATGPRVESLTVDSSFATVEGAGTPEKFNLTIAADLAAAAREAAKFVDIPADALSGRADVSVRVETAELERRLTADTRLENLRVEVAPDRVLREESLSLRAEARTDAGDDVPRVFRDVNMHFESGFGTADTTIGRVAVGETLAGTEMADLATTVRVDLARISSLHEVLRPRALQTGLAGTLEGSLKGSLASGLLDLGPLRVVLRDLVVRRGDRTMSQEQLRLSGALQTDLTDRRVAVTGAELEFAGGRFNASGISVPDWRAPLSGTEAEFSGEADLGRLFADLGASEPMPSDVTMAGRLSLSGSVRPAADPAGRELSANARIAGFRLSRAGGAILEDESMQLTFDTTVAPASGGEGYRLHNLSLITDGRLLSSRLVAAGVTAGPAVEKWAVSDLRIKSEASLGPLALIARQLGVGPADVEVAGDVALRCSGSLEAGMLELPDLSVSAKELSVARGGKAFREPELGLAAVARADLGKRSVRVDRATLECSVGSAAASDLTVPDWSRLPQGLTGNLTASSQLARALDAMRAFAQPPGGMRMEGKLDFQSAFSVDEDGLTADAGISLRPLKLRRGRSPWFNERSLDIQVAATVARGREDVVLDSVQVSSEPGILRARASGALKGWRGARHLTLEGKVRPDWARCGVLLSALTGKDIEMEGAEERPFKVNARLGEMDWAKVLQQTTAEGGVHVRRLSYAGVEAEDMEVSVKSEDNRLGWVLSGRINQGPLNFSPVLRARDGGPALVLPEPGTVLTGAQITDQMANNLLGRALPVFREPVDVEGTASLALNELDVPVAGGLQNATIDAVLTLRAASVGSSGVLRSLLSLVGLEEKTIDIPEQNVRLLLRDGRVHHGRMPLQIERYTLVSSGSVGLDKTLDLTVEVPVTPELVESKSLYDMLKGQSIKVRIGGTLDHPRFDRDIIQDNLKSLMRGSTRNLLERLLE